MAAQLEVHNLSVDYGRIRAVSGISFEARAGRVTAIVGPNGAGKTSTVLGTYGSVASRGEVRAGGHSIEGLPALARAKLGISLVPQGRQLFPRLTVSENLEVMAKLLGLPGSAIEEALLRFPILKKRAAYRAGVLSGGEQQMLALTRALMPGPKILLLDEMMTGLAPLIVDSFLEAIRELARQGMTVLMSEPDIAQISDAIDCGYVMQRGTIVNTAQSGADLVIAYQHAMGLLQEVANPANRGEVR